VYLKGTTAEAEMFAMLPYAAAVLLAVKGMRQGGGGKAFFWTGMAAAMAFLYKVVFLAPLGIALGMILLDAWRRKNESKGLRLSIYRCLGLAGGFAVVTGLVFSYFAWEGLLERFLLVFSLGSAYVNTLIEQMPIYFILLIPINLLAENNIFITIFSLAGSISLGLIVWRKGFFHATEGIVAAGLLAWFGLSVLTAGITRMPYRHYALIILPALAVIAGWEWEQLYGVVASVASTWKKRVGQFSLAAVLTLTVFSSVQSNFAFYASYLQYKVGAVSYEEFVTKGTLEGSIYRRTKELVAYITARTNPEDLIFHWTEFPKIYYEADRRAPVDMIWPIQIELAGSSHQIFQPQTQYIIVGASKTLPEPAWMKEGLKKSYHLEAEIDEQKIYRRNDP
jgi:hypothetical protein